MSSHLGWVSVAKLDAMDIIKTILKDIYVFSNIVVFCDLYQNTTKTFISFFSLCRVSLQHVMSNSTCHWTSHFVVIYFVILCMCKSSLSWLHVNILLLIIISLLSSSWWRIITRWRKRRIRRREWSSNNIYVYYIYYLGVAKWRAS